MIPVKGQINELKDHVEEASQKKKKKKTEQNTKRWKSWRERISLEDPGDLPWE